MPVSDVLVVDPIDHVLAKNEVGQMHGGIARHQPRRNQVGLLQRGPRLTVADSFHDAALQPLQVRLQTGEHRRRRIEARQRIVSMEQRSRIVAGDHVDRVEEPRKVALLDEGRAQIRHQDVPDEHHALLREEHEQRVSRLASAGRLQDESSAADRDLAALSDRHVGAKVFEVFDAEAASEEALEHCRLTAGSDRHLFGEVLARVEPGGRLEAAEEAVPADVIPVRMRHENGGQLGQLRSGRPKRIVRRLGGVGARPRVDPDELAPVPGHDEVELREVVAGDLVHPPRHDLADALARERMAGRWVLRVDGKRDRAVEARGARESQELLGLCRIPVFVIEDRQPKRRRPDPSLIRRLGRVRETPVEIHVRLRLLVKAGGKLRTDDSGDPAHDEDAASGELLGLIQHGDRLPNPRDAMKERDLRGRAGAQRGDRRQIEGPLRIRQLRIERLQACFEKLRSFPMPVGVGVVRHQQEEHLGIARRALQVDGL